ncbi:MAG TPA: hypothetical protein VMY06_01685 [Sedimentisphaerales bacterium]|nr:hypothetical protein [Sedimentisphaerales bacterium]
MVEQESIEKPRQKRKVLRTLLIVLVIIIAAFWAYRSALRARLNTRLDTIAAAGYPVTCAELDNWYAIPESVENAADYMTEAFSHYHKLEEPEESELMPVVGHAELPGRTETLAEETKALITQYLADNEQALELLRKGAAIEHSRYPIDLSKGFEALMPYLSDIRTGARLLKLEAVVHAENDKPQMANNSIKSMLGLARSLSKEPVLVSQLVRIACRALAVSTLEHAINSTEFTDEQLVKLIGALAEAEDPSAMVRAFAGEQCAGFSIFKMPAAQIPRVLDMASDRPHLLGVIAISLYRFVGLADMDAAAYLDLMNDYIKAMQLPPYQRQDAVGTIKDKFDKISKIHIFLRLIMPAFSRVTTIDIRSIAQLRTAQAGLAIERYRLATDKLPDTLAELSPTYLDAVPKDPFDGKDLRYKKLDVGFVVYSIGEDGSDDGGKEKPRKKARPPAPEDVTFIVQR